jgi:hypothetical protein
MHYPQQITHSPTAASLEHGRNVAEPVMGCHRKSFGIAVSAIDVAK